MTLINTIEFSPSDYTPNDYEFPNCSKKENPQAWDDFWRKCLADSQLTNVRPIEQGSYLVDIESLSDFELRAVVKNKLKDLDDDLDYEEQISAICGGIVVEIEGEFAIQPSCCGDLGNLPNWENMLTAKKFLENMLNVQITSIKLLASEHTTGKVYTEKNYSDIKPVLTLIWMVDDMLGFKDDYVVYTTLPEAAKDFITDDVLWQQPLANIAKEREKTLKTLQNKTKGLDFFSQNKIIYIFQKNIIKNGKTKQQN